MTLDFRNKSNISGFTLLEVMIAFMVLVFISFAIYQLTTNTFKLRSDLSAEGDFYNEIRLSMGILRQDLSMVFSPKLLIPETPNLNQQGRGNPQNNSTNTRQQPQQQSPEIEPPSEYWGFTLDQNTGIRNTRFLGEEKRILFVGSTHLRIYRDAPESIYSKIEYEVVSDESPSASKNRRTHVLVKRSNPNVFNLEVDDDDFQKTYPLLRGITEWRFRYYQRRRDRWFNEWDSRKNEFRGVFPDLIEVSMTVIGPKEKEFNGFYRFHLDIPFEGINAQF